MINVEGKIRNILVDQCYAEREEINRETTLGEDLGADSLDMVEIVMACEEEFGIAIPDDDATPLTRATSKVCALIDYVEGRLAARRP